MQQTIPQNDGYIASHVGSTPSSGPFAVDFPFFSMDDVKVTTQADGSSLIFTLVRGADYTLTGVATDDGSFSSGSLTLANPVSLTTVTRLRQTPVERLSTFPLQGFFSRLALNAELNKITVWMQERHSDSGGFSGNALRTPAEEFGLGVTAAAVSLRQGKVLAWDATGNLVHSTVPLADIEAGAGGGTTPSPIVGITAGVGLSGGGTTGIVNIDLEADAPGTVPIGGIVDFAGATAPANWLICRGQPLATTGPYAALFAVLGYLYGGSGATFNAPDLGGRVTAGKETAATRLTVAGAGIDGSVLGANGGVQTHTLTIAQLAAHGHNSFNGVTLMSNLNAAQGGLYTAAAGVDVPVFNAGTGVAGAGSSAPHQNTQPTIVMNKIIRYA